MRGLIKKNKDFLNILLLVLLSVFLTYFIPVSLNRIIFPLLLIPAWISKKDYFWFALILIYLEHPGGLFYGGEANDIYRLPIYSLIRGISFSFEEIFLIFFFFKALIKKRIKLYKFFIFRKQYDLLALYLLILIIISFILGMSSDSIRNLYKTLIKTSLFLSVFLIFKNKDDIIKFLRILFPFAIIAILLQIYSLSNQQQLVSLFKPEIISIQGVLEDVVIMRPIEMPVIILLCFFGSLFYFDFYKGPFSRHYLLLINIISFLSILMTATRTWFLGFLAMYIIYFLLNIKNIRIILRIFITAFVFILIVWGLSPTIKEQVNSAWTRIETLEDLVEGDLTAGGTLSRITERGPRVMKAFKQSTIIVGFGFSNSFYENGDGHVGYQNILLNSGIIGLFLFTIFAFTIIYKSLRMSKMNNITLSQKRNLRNIIILVPTLLIITTGTQFWGYTVAEWPRVIALAFYFSMLNIYLQSVKTNKSISTKTQRDNSDYNNITVTSLTGQAVDSRDKF